MEKLSYDKNVRFKYINRFETELKWIKLLQTPSPLGFNENIYHEENISKMPNFDVFSLLAFRKRKSRSHGLWNKGNDKGKRCSAMISNISLYDLSTRLSEHCRHAMISFLSSLPVAVFRIVDTEANRFYFNTRNKCLTAKLLKQGYRYHKLRKAFSKFYRRLYELISKFNVGLKSLLHKGLSEPEFYGDLVYKFKKIRGMTDFSDQFRKIIMRYKRIGYNLNVMRQS